MWYNFAVQAIDVLHDEIRACRRCQDDGFPISPPPLVWGYAPAPFMLIGQAPGLSDLRGGRMYLGPAARRLFGWLDEAGFTEREIGTTLYLTALTKCYPGRVPGKSTDRAPGAKERGNCGHWLTAQIELVQPKVVILFGKMAIDTFLPGALLDTVVGQEFEKNGTIYIPFPHSSGASTWLNAPHRQALLAEAITTLNRRRTKVLQARSGRRGGVTVEQH